MYCPLNGIGEITNVHLVKGMYFKSDGQPKVKLKYKIQLNKTAIRNHKEYTRRLLRRSV
jgi:hypothetical protein